MYDYFKISKPARTSSLGLPVASLTLALAAVTPGCGVNIGIEDDVIGDSQGDDIGESEGDDADSGEEVGSSEDTGTSEGTEGSSDTSDDAETSEGSGDQTGTDSDATEGSSDTEEESGPGDTCADLSEGDLELGSIGVEVSIDHGLAASCGAPGADALYTFTAPAAATFRFALDQAQGFSPVLYLVGECDPIVELACEPEPGEIDLDLEADQTVYVVVDSSEGAGTVQLTVSQL